MSLRLTFIACCFWNGTREALNNRPPTHDNNSWGYGLRF